MRMSDMPRDDNLPVFMAAWMLLQPDFNCTLESDQLTGLIIYLNTPDSDSERETERIEIERVMRRCGDDTLKLDWCDGNWTITTA